MFYLHISEASECRIPHCTICLKNCRFSPSVSFVAFSHLLLCYMLYFRLVLLLTDFFMCLCAAGLRAPLLPPMHTDTGPQFRDHVRLPGPQAPQGGAGHRMRPLWLQGMCQRRLTDQLCCHHDMPWNQLFGFNHSYVFLKRDLW